jgi:hypothetical protein
MDVKEKDGTAIHLTDEQTAHYVDYLLNENSKRPLDSTLHHVEHCPMCKDNIMDVFLCLKNSRPRLNTKPFHTLLPETKMQKPFRKNYSYLKRIAASFFIMALFITIYFTVIDNQLFQKRDVFQNNKTAVSNQNNQHSLTATKKPNRFNTHKNTLPTTENNSYKKNKNFKINPNLEYMINSQLRDESIKVNSPANNSIVNNNIVFAWESFPSKPIQLKILNNQNDILFEYSIQTNKFVLKETLSPGLYYWKLENQTDLLHVGKFFIEKQITVQAE